MRDGGSVGAGAPGRPAREEGFTIVGLLILVAIVNVMLAAAATSWITLDRRAREAELLFRGQAIARGIACHQAEHASEPLLRLDQLVKENCLRRAYRDPMSRDGAWRILRRSDLADPEIAALLGFAGPPPAAAGGDAQAGAGVRAGQGLQIGSRLLGSRAAVAAGGDAIIGVVSSAEGFAARSFHGKRKYSEWAFVAAATGAGS